MDLTTIKERVADLRSDRTRLKKNFKTLSMKARLLQKELDTTQEAILIVREVGQQTQKKLEFHMTNTIKLALATVFDDPYAAKLAFEIKRGKPEVELYYGRGGNWTVLENNVGVGSVDIGAIGSRIAMWQITKPKTRPLFLLDEPMKHLRGQEQQERASSLLREISKELGIQMIIIADIHFSIDADREFHVAIHDGISQVEGIDHA
jgi:hypothetical protein